MRGDVQTTDPVYSKETLLSHESSPTVAAYWVDCTQLSYDPEAYPLCQFPQKYSLYRDPTSPCKLRNSCSSVRDLLVITTSELVKSLCCPKFPESFPDKAGVLPNPFGEATGAVGTRANYAWIFNSSERQDLFFPSFLQDLSPLWWETAGKQSLRAMAYCFLLLTAYRMNALSSGMWCELMNGFSGYERVAAMI
jgi:hypothetical protein